MSFLTELEELKDQLVDTPIAEEVQRRLSRQNSRVSLPRSEGDGSEFQSNGSLAGRKLSRDSGFKGKSPPGKQMNGAIDKKGMGPKRGQRLIEKEKAEVGKVRVDVYKYYLQNVGYIMISIIFSIQLITQGFGVASNAWLGEWSDDDTLVVDGVVNTAKRDMYLGVYGAIGFGQGMKITFYSNSHLSHIK